MTKLLTEYQAAAQTGMSPELLRWLTKFAPKQGDPRKLKIAKQERDLVFFDEAELESFNAWLRNAVAPQKWKASSGSGGYPR